MAKTKVHSNAKIKFILNKDGKIKIKYSKQEEKNMRILK
jgi:hypothetical protein